VALEQIGTDRDRWASYTQNFSAAQNTLYAGYPWRFSHFRKTAGYANQPLDGIWARSPYLHNGSVPTLRDLLERRPAAKKIISRQRYLRYCQVGYRTDGYGFPEELFLYDTSVPAIPTAGMEKTFEPNCRPPIKTPSGA
jgi:hypothetical protein